VAFRVRSPFMDFGRGVIPSDGMKASFFEVGTSTPLTTYSDVGLTTPNASPVVSDGNGMFSDIFIGVSADMVLTDKNNTVIFSADTVYEPGSQISSLAASLVTVLDTAGNFTAGDAEAVLAEMAANWVRKDRADTITGDKTFSGATLDMGDNQLIQPVLTDYAIQHNVITSVAGVLTIDMATGNSFEVTLTENITSIVITNPPAAGLKGQFTLEVIQDNAGGAYTMAQPAGVIAPGGILPVISVGNAAKDDLTYRTNDGGAIWKLDFSQVYS